MKLHDVQQDHLEAQLHQWQKRLRLQDWLVTVSLARRHDISGNMGQITSSRKYKRAHIELMDPIDHDPDRQVPYDVETTLVHELLHLHFVTLDLEPDTPQDDALEQAINLIAHALVGRP